MKDIFGTSLGQPLPLTEHVEAVEKGRDLVVDNACIMLTHDSGSSLDVRRFTLKLRCGVQALAKWDGVALVGGLSC